MSKEYKDFSKAFKNVIVASLPNNELRYYRMLCEGGMKEADEEITKRGL